MASRSIPGAVIDRFASLNFAAKPPTLWFGDADTRNPGSGSPVDLPLVEFYQEPAGALPITFEYNPLDVQAWFRFEVWAVTLEACTDVCLGLLFGDPAADPTAGGGFFAGGALAFAPGSFVFKGLSVPQWPHYEGGVQRPRGPDARRCYRGTFRLLVQAEYRGGG